MYSTDELALVEAVEGRASLENVGRGRTAAEDGRRFWMQRRRMSRRKVKAEYWSFDTSCNANPSWEVPFRISTLDT